MQGLKQAAAVAAALWAAIAFAPAVQAQGDYPNKPIRIVVGFIPGSSADITARVLGNKLGQILGQSIVSRKIPDFYRFFLIFIKYTTSRELYHIMW